MANRRERLAAAVYGMFSPEIFAVPEQLGSGLKLDNLEEISTLRNPLEAELSQELKRPYYYVVVVPGDAM